MSLLKLFKRHNTEEHTNSIASYFPAGDAFEAVNIDGSVARNFLKGLSIEFKRGEDALQSYIEEYGIEESEELLGRWESAIGIPDDCFSGNGSLESRRRDVVVKLAALGVQTSSDFVDLAKIFGVDITVTAGIINANVFPFQFPIVFYPSVKAARFTIVITFDLQSGGRFPYIFPIKFGVAEINVLECLFRKLKPANCDIIFQQV
jgi:uncharacterized protein YmfQ (DUF2313 family)